MIDKIYTSFYEFQLEISNLDFAQWYYDHSENRGWIKLKVKKER